MRCKNCGWTNPENVSVCEKCHAPLNAPEPQYEAATPINEQLKSTVSENMAFGGGVVSNPSNACPKCGYPVSTDMNQCPNCNHVLSSKPQQVDQQLFCSHCGQANESGSRFCSSCGSPLTEKNAPSGATGSADSPKKIQRSSMGTVMSGPAAPFSQGTFCTLRPIAWQGETIQYNPVTYSGDSIVLNRSNTDPNNNSITSKQQAILTLEDGEWYIENRSELKTTYIRVGEKIKIKSGDIIVLGNREFEFKG